MRDYILFFRSPQTKWQENAGKEAKATLMKVRDLCAKFLDDGVVDDDEARLLYDTLQRSAGVLPTIGLADLPVRFGQIFNDGIIDDAERNEITEIAKEIVRCVDEPESKPRVAGLPYIEPNPLILDDKLVVITGVFLFGKRKKVEIALGEQGAMLQSDVTQDTDFIIVGSAPSPGWAHGNYGRKVEAALSLQARSHPIGIISEGCWRSTF